MRSTRAKSPRLRVAPIPSMINWISGVLSPASSKSPQVVKWAGNQSAQHVIVNTQNVNAIMLSLGWRWK